MWREKEELKAWLTWENGPSNLFADVSEQWLAVCVQEQ